MPQALIHAGNDGVVPASMSRDYQRLATSNGDRARFILVDGIGHRQLIDPNGPGWAMAVSEMQQLIG